MTPDDYHPDTGAVMENENAGSSLPPPPALDFDAARALIAERHGTGLDADDPILMTVTLHGAFMGDYERMLARHNAAITTVMGSALKGLTDKALAAHLENQVRLADRIEQTFRHQYRRARALTAINLLATIVCIPVLIVLILK